MIILVVAMVMSFLSGQVLSEKIRSDQKKSTRTMFSVTSPAFRERQKKRHKFILLHRIMNTITILLGTAVLYLILYMDQVKVFYIMGATICICAIWITIELGVKES